MSTNLLSLAQQALGGDFPQLAGQFLGESEGSTQSALATAVGDVRSAARSDWPSCCKACSARASTWSNK